MPDWISILVLVVAVLCVIGATQPSPPRRRPARVSRRRSTAVSAPTPVPHPSPDTGQRNHWDRPDLERGVGRDVADPDISLNLWPAAPPETIGPA